VLRAKPLPARTATIITLISIVPQSTRAARQNAQAVDAELPLPRLPTAIIARDGTRADVLVYGLLAGEPISALATR
jgi:hypothetical protein